MPELPDITVYIESLERKILGKELRRARATSPFVLRTFDPPLSSVAGHLVKEIRRLGKRIAIGLDSDLWVVIHLMVLGRLRWRDKPPAKPDRSILSVFEFDSGCLVLTESGTKKRASMHVLGSSEELARHDPGGLEVLDADMESFGSALTRENHTLKRALTDPHLFSGIGNSYSDEILHVAGLSPIQMTQKLTPDQVKRLHAAVGETLRTWIQRLRSETAEGFPEKVTAFRSDMRVHGRFGKPCPSCGAPIQRIRYSENETNYCPRCQTGGRILADRSLSRLLKKDWPKTLEELEQRTVKQTRIP